MAIISSHQKAPTILLVAASRGLGLAMADEFLKQGWNVVGTVRDKSAKTKLHDLAEQYADRVQIETLDICEPSQIAELSMPVQLMNRPRRSVTLPPKSLHEL
jgi:NAD(P)-dependent dehydrogenase (short-subunit alcohol dehydrogenase family)